ncbi:Putative disease resistance protein RGA3 [Dendrobium catenatum]|uniref:Disease resistance protein RGA3 n=1 Tax=Dendrobium catenatum TaxID=906689 RepID=A0A2I0XI22_9ASPA|nr:Putative disease resistance protein RGA3 [Dendrobium catenatum]
MSKIINGCSDYLEKQVGWQTGMNKELESLRKNHPKIQAVVFAANQAQISDQNHPINKWIWELRDALDEVNDVLDEFEYMKHKQQLTKNMEETEERTAFSNVSFLVDGLRIAGERALKIDPRLKGLEEVVQKLHNVSAGFSNFLPLLDIAKQGQQEQQRQLSEARETGCLPTTNDLIGRSKDMESVKQWLRKPSNKPRTSRFRNISLLSIVGHGGMGKTTLLQHVYEDEMTKEFDLKLWVCVSNNFDVKKVIADMLSTLKKERPRLDDTLDALQKSLKNKVKSKRFLLVLDDVWEEEEKRDKSKWGIVLAPLAYGDFGSKILVTTRTDSVALMFEEVILEKTEALRLEGLEDEECLELLNTHAFAVDNLDDKRKLKLITAEIAKKLSGYPLAAKVIGGILMSKLDEEHWRRVLDSVLEIIKSGDNIIMPILRLSYVHLPECLKSCFTFCSIFPQDYEFDKDALVRHWIALDFIQQSHIQGEIMEDIGGRYFDVLVKKNFFDKFGRYYKMHDLIHELAQSVSIHECLRVEDGTKFPSIIPKTLRHLFVKTTYPNIIKKIGHFEHLHSLFLFHYASNQDLFNALIEIFKAWRSLRLLYIWALEDLKIIPEEIGNLMHLRYLKIEADHLTMIRGIGKLNSLQELDMFDLRDVSGYRIGELENMNDLCKLGINYLENVKNVEEACSAKLCAKRRLTDLTLCWCNTYSTDNIDFDEYVFDNLQSPECLRNLSINNYIGTRSPIWMNNVNPISNLEKIELTFCRDWETLPPFGKLRFLKSLKLCFNMKVKWLESKFNGNEKYDAFPLLEVLHISYLDALEDWFEAGVAAEDGCLFPCLIELKIDDCRKLKELPSFPSKLKSLQIRYTGWKTLNFCSISNSIPLETLEVLHCPNITSLPLADEIARFAAPRDLIIKLTECLECETLPPFGQLPFLKSLILDNMPKVKWLESKFNGNDKYRAFPLLEVLHIDRLEALEDWFEAGVAAEDGCLFPSLTELYLYDCPKLKESPSLPSKLKRLGIYKIGWTTLNFCSNSNPIPLESLKVSDCPNITSLPLADEISRLAALRDLVIRKCPNLISLGEMQTTNNCHIMLSNLSISDPSVLLMEPLRSTASLKELSIEYNDEVVSFPNEAEQWFESLSSLQILSIYDVPILRELPNLPPSLESLEIWGRCHPELKERYRENGGFDRHKIAHIPFILMDT